MKNSKQELSHRLGLPQILGLLIAFLVSILVILPALTQGPITLTVLMHMPEATQWRSLIQDFEAKNPDIRINLIEGPNRTDTEEDLYTTAFLLENSPYDLVYMDVIWGSKFAAAGWLRDLSDRISEAELAKFMPTDVEAGRYEGGLYRIPFRSDVGILYYREDLLKQARYQPPETFTELMQISQALQKQEAADWGYVWQGRQDEGVVATFVEVLEGYGGFWINPETLEVGLDQPAAIQAIEFLRNTIQQGISPPGITVYGAEETLRLFQSGQAMFLRSWPYVWPLANAPDSPVQGKVAIQPMVHAPGYGSGACLGGWGMGISKTTKHPEAAWRAIQFFTSAEAQRQFILETGYVPSRKELFSDSQIVAKYDYYPKLLEIVEQAVLRPPVAQYAQASDTLQRYLSAALTEQLSPQQAMQAAAAETRRMLSRFHADVEQDEA